MPSDVEIDGGKELALPKALQRDPIKSTIDHVDLLLVRKGEKVTVELSIALVGEVERGGRVNQDLTNLTVEAEATNIPDGVEVNIDGLQIGHQLLAKDVALPQGVTLVTDPEAAVVGVVAVQSAAQAEAEIEAAEAEAGVVRDEKQTADA